MPGTYHIRPATRLKFVCTLLSIIVCCAAGFTQADDSGCVDCHTDEELLSENLAQQTKKKSSLQAGAG